jgi:hypothetical protein
MVDGCNLIQMMYDYPPTVLIKFIALEYGKMGVIFSADFPKYNEEVEPNRSPPADVGV